MNDLERSNYLAHYGVVGMKWGVRRTPEQLGRAAAKRSGKRPFVSITINKGAKKPGSKTAAKAKKGKADKRNPRADMPDDQLSSEVKRLRLESEHKRLMADLYPKKQSVIKKLVTDSAINTGRLALNKIGENVVNNAFREKFNPKDYDIKDVSKADPKKLKRALEYKRDQAAYTRITEAAKKKDSSKSSPGPKKYKVSRSSVAAKQAKTSSSGDPWGVRNRRADRHKSQADRRQDIWPFSPPSTKPVGRRTARQAEIKQQKKQKKR